MLSVQLEAVRGVQSAPGGTVDNSDLDTYRVYHFCLSGPNVAENC